MRVVQRRSMIISLGLALCSSLSVRSECADLSSICAAHDEDDCNDPWLAAKCCASCAKFSGPGKEANLGMESIGDRDDVFAFNAPRLGDDRARSEPMPPLIAAHMPTRMPITTSTPSCYPMSTDRHSRFQNTCVHTCANAYVRSGRHSGHHSHILVVIPTDMRRRPVCCMCVTSGLV